MTAGAIPDLILFFFQQLCELVHKGVDILELPVDGGETDIGYFVNTLELLHRKLAYINGCHLAVERILKHGLYLADSLFELFHIDGTLFTRLEHTVEKLVSVKDLTRFVLFDNDYRHGFDYLISCEALAAAHTLAAAADSLALVGGTRVDDLALFKTTERTLQSNHSLINVNNIYRIKTVKCQAFQVCA